MSATSPRDSQVPRLPLGRLPFDLREEVCRMLRDRQTGRSIDAWISSKGFGPYKPQNYSNFRKGYYKEWLKGEAHRDGIRKKSEETRRELDAIGVSVLDKGIYDFAEALSGTDVEPVAAARAIAALRNAVTAAERTKTLNRRTDIAADQAKLARERFEVEVCEKILAAYGDDVAKSIATSGAPRSEVIKALRQHYYADVDALEKSGGVQIPQ